MKTAEIGKNWFLTQQSPPGYSCDFDPILYNLPEFLGLRTSLTPWVFNLCSNSKQTISARISFCVQDQVAYSGLFGPFGSFDMSEGTPEEELSAAIIQIMKTLVANSVVGIVIHHYPRFYASPGVPNLGPVLMPLGFEVKKSQLNHHLETRHSFDLLLHPMEKRKLNLMQAQKPDFLQEWHQNLAEVFAFIESCRTEKGQSMSLSLEEISAMFDRFPDRYHLFTLRLNQELVAASICVLVNRRVMYNFYPASSRRYNRLSPLVYLIGQINIFCRNHDIQILDLGTSEVNGRLNPRLSGFKDRIGGTSSLRYSYQWCPPR